MNWTAVGQLGLINKLVGFATNALYFNLWLWYLPQYRGPWPKEAYGVSGEYSARGGPSDLELPESVARSTPVRLAGLPRGWMTSRSRTDGT